ncbi:hypothetical protein V6R86_05700 [Sphingomonas kaistensis]|uniref:Uncharacterized protein n=1 Tax=Sphingomonas kaistensis TaxID=298708 RepID=A0ABZ2G353_9SPHN
MANAHAGSHSVPKSFWMGAVAVLLFMGVGVAGYLVTMMTPLEQMPAEQQAKMAAMPGWQTAVYAVAVWSGLLGAIGLLLRRSWSVVALLVSLIGAIGTFLPFLVVSQVRALGTMGDAIAAAIVIGLCAASLWFAHHSQQKGWLR